MKKIVLHVLTLLLAVASSTAQQAVTYPFPDNKDITICPTITRSSSTSRPNFRLEPVTVTPNDLFLLGTYDVPDTAIPEAIFDRENTTCSKLSLRYGGDAPPNPKRGSFTITYTGLNGVTRRIHVNFGYAGVYLRDESAGLVVGRVPNSTVLNNSLVLFGTPDRLVTCLENGTEAPSNLLQRSIPGDFSDEECFGSNLNQTNSQPVLFTLIVSADRMGRERIYFGDSDCSDDNRISDTFLFIFDPPATEGPDSTTTTTDVGATPSPPATRGFQDVAIGVGVGVGVAILITILMALVFFLIYYCKKPRQKAVHSVERGSGNHSKEASVSTVDGSDGPSSSPNLLIGNGHLHQKMPPPRGSTKKKLHVVKYKDSKAMNTVEETLAELNEESYELAATQENGFLPTYMTNIINAGHRVIILHGCKESKSQSDDKAARWVKELESNPDFTKKRLDNVFVVYLGRTQPPAALQMIPRLQRIPISQHPDDEDNNFDASTVAKLIQKEIVKLSPLNRQPIAASPPAPPLDSSTDSRPPAGSANPSRLVTRNRGAVAEDPNEHPPASPAEPSQLSSTTENRPEDRTGQAVAYGTIETISGARKFLAENTELSSTASTPATTRSQGEDDLRSSPSAPSMIRVEDVMKTVVTQFVGVVEAQGKKAIQEIREAKKEIKDTVEKKGDEIESRVGKEGEETRGKVGQEGEETRGKVEEKGDEIESRVEKEGAQIRDKVGEEGDKLLESIEFVADATEQVRIDIENQNVQVNRPYGDGEEETAEQPGSAEPGNDTP